MPTPEVKFGAVMPVALATCKVVSEAPMAVVSSSLSPIPTNDCGGSTFREKFGYPHPQAPDPPILTLAPRRPHVRSAGFVKSAVYVRGRAFNSFREHD